MRKLDRRWENEARLGFLDRRQGHRSPEGLRPRCAETLGARAAGGTGASFTEVVTCPGVPPRHDDLPRWGFVIRAAT